MIKLLIFTALAILIGAVWHGFFVKGVVFSLGILAGVEIVRWAKRRQAGIKAVGQIVIDSIELSGTFLYHSDYWEFIVGNGKYLSYDQGATWIKAAE